MSNRKSRPTPTCAACDVDSDRRICKSEDGIGYKGCPSLTRQNVLEGANQEYEASQLGHFARQASIQEAACYTNRHRKPFVMQPTKTRLVEIGEFAERMGYRKLGLAFCMGLRQEAAVVHDLLTKRDFEVISVICKAGKTPKSSIGLSDDEQVQPGVIESMCNPVFQAKIMNNEQSDFNVVMGLCVGHDSMFFKYSEAPVTVLAVKDRVTGHNPLAAIYTSESYYKKLHFPDLT